MRKTLLTYVSLCCFVITLNAQESHLSLLYDFEGNDFDNSVEAMVGVNDSLYIIKNTANYQGCFFRIDENGEGYTSIWEFDDVNYGPISLVANDTIIYGTTSFSALGGGTLFSYNLRDYTFEFIKDFVWPEIQQPHIKYITDSVLWLNAIYSHEGEGCIFTIEKDGSDVTKIYSDTNMEKGQNPVDFVFHNDSIYIACFNGGGIPYEDGTGETVSSGSFIRVKADGTGYQNLVQGQDGVGTQPQSIIIQEGKMIGLFAYSGSTAQTGGRFFRCNTDGSAYEAIGALKDRALTKMYQTDSLIYGISSREVFGVNPYDGEIRIFDDLLSNPDFGYDVVSTPAYLGDNIYLAAQQGGPGGGGTLLKWTNQKPEVNEIKSVLKSKSTEIDLEALFSDPEGDSLSYDIESDAEVSIDRKDNRLIITPPDDEEVKVKITANDGWDGYTSITLTINTNSAIGENLPAAKLNLYPNPVESTLYIGNELIDQLDILSINGELVRSINEPGNEVELADLPEGLYIIRCRINDRFYSQKIIKQ